MFYKLLLFFLLLILWSCSPKTPDKRLVAVADKVSEAPEEALADLGRINYDSLGTDDRYYYDFLTIKARDKAYVTHTSDSLYLRVLDYYSRHSDSPLYPEVLYYGGRVYSDLGDYPTSLRYFQSALDHLPADTDNLSLRGTVLSQTARLLNTLRLYSDAIPYIKESIEIDRQLGDTIGEVYDIQLLGAIYLRAEDYNKAERCFRSALDKSVGLPVSHRAISSMYLAGVKYKMGQIDSAVIYIRNTPELVKQVSRNNALSWAADIYYAAGIMDSAYYYAHALINSKDDLNKEFGYGTLLSPQLWHRLPMDTIKAYLAEYRNLIESSFNRNENELAVNQQSLYNYQIHERERLRTEKRNSRLIYATGFLSLIVLFAAVIILSLKYRKHRMLLELNSTILELEELRKSLTDGKRLENGYVQSPVSPQPASDLDNLKNRLQEQIDSLTDELARKTPVSSAILSSDAYHTISGCIVENKTIPDNSPLWAELEQTILADSPLFRQRLQLLAGQDLKPHDYHLVLLIRCGVTPTQTTILLGRAKGTVSYRRRHVCEMLLGRKVDPHFIDDIIRCI